MSLSKPMNKQNNPTYRFEVIPKSWSKRRKPDEELKILTVEIPDFELKEQHFCNMHVHYEDGSENVFYSRVIRNSQTGQWTVDGMHVAVKVIIPAI